MLIAARVSLITLGVADLHVSTTFYGRLGWRRSLTGGTDAISFFALSNLVLALYSRAALAEDAGLPDTPLGFGGFALAQNVESEAEVERALLAAVKAGAQLLKPAHKAGWGGYSGYFADPDGHPWEIAYNPHFPLNERGEIVLPT